MVLVGDDFLNYFDGQFFLVLVEFVVQGLQKGFEVRRLLEIDKGAVDAYGRGNWAVCFWIWCLFGGFLLVVAVTFSGAKCLDLKIHGLASDLVRHSFGVQNIFFVLDMHDFIF